MTTSAPPRRFKVEPIETTVRSSRRVAPDPTEVVPKKPRRFAPEPVETTTRSNRKAPTGATAVAGTAKIQGDSKANAIEVNPLKSVQPKQDEKTATSSQKTPRPRRRFAPQLIETAKRSRRAGDQTTALSDSDRTEAVPNSDHVQNSGLPTPKRSPSPSGGLAAPTICQSPHILDIRQVHSLISRPNSRSSNRSHSFRVPDLDTIESSESEEDRSTPPSLSTSPSLSDTSYLYKHATRLRESVDDRYSGYLLRLASKAAEQRLRDQALAAFPNDDHHEPVDHFIDGDAEENELHASRLRRGSNYSRTNWELRAMQQHHERRLNSLRLNERRSHEFDGSDSTMMSIESPWRKNPAVALFAHERMPSFAQPGKQEDGEMNRMLDSARPPMLGSDLTFPRCSSPDQARFDVTQGPRTAREAAMSYSAQQSQRQDSEGLWCGKGSQDIRNSFRSNPGSRRPSHGLWGGYCTGTGLTPPRAPSGLLTPQVEKDNPFETPHSTSAPPTKGIQPDFSNIDEKLNAELKIEEEFSDEFITQVYNYLSLGYPSIGRAFDEELSKISRVPMSDLRQDDYHAKTRGYIRLGEDSNSDEITEETCMRWKALRLYVREWARQHPRMANEDKPAGIGVVVRRGSWAW